MQACLRLFLLQVCIILSYSSVCGNFGSTMLGIPHACLWYRKWFSRRKLNLAAELTCTWNLDRLDPLRFASCTVFHRERLGGGYPLTGRPSGHLEGFFFMVFWVLCFFSFNFFPVSLVFRLSGEWSTAWKTVVLPREAHVCFCVNRCFHVKFFCVNCCLVACMA